MMYLSPHRRMVLLFGALILLLCVSSAPALVVVQKPLVRPEGTLSPGAPVQVSLDLVVIPAGADTFQPGHTLVFSTDLEKPRWVIEITLDGVPNDRSTWYNNVVFFNGYLLAYPTTRDVSLRIDLDGDAPAGAGKIDLIRVVELDNQGKTVPGSEIAASGTVAPPETPAPVTTAAIPLTSTPTLPPGPTTTAALSGLLPLIAITAACLTWRYGWVE